VPAAQLTFVSNTSNVLTINGTFIPPTHNTPPQQQNKYNISTARRAKADISHTFKFKQEHVLFQLEITLLFTAENDVKK